MRWVTAFSTMLVVIAACGALVAADDQLPAETPARVPGEILIKVTPEARTAIERARAAGQLPHTGVASFDAVLTRLGATAIEPLFPQFDPKRIAQKFPKRAARAPEDAAIPELSRLYKVVVSLDTDIPAAAAELGQDPHVEYAEPNSVVSIELPEINAEP